MASKEYKFPAFDEAPKVEGMVKKILFFDIECSFLGFRCLKRI